MDQQRGRPVLVEFWDFCRVSSLRTLDVPQGVARALRRGGAARRVGALPRLRAVARRGRRARRGEAAGRSSTRCSSTRTSGSGRRTATRAGPPGICGITRRASPATPSRVPRRRGRLRGDRAARSRPCSASSATSSGRCARRTTRTRSSSSRRPTSRARTPARTRRAACGPSSPERASSGNGSEIAVDHPGAYPLIEHEVHTAGVLELEVGDGVECHAVSFTPGLAP